MLYSNCVYLYAGSRLTILNKRQTHVIVAFEALIQVLIKSKASYSIIHFSTNRQQHIDPGLGTGRKGWTGMAVS